jgi:hypothetical protein
LSGWVVAPAGRAGHTPPPPPPPPPPTHTHTTNRNSCPFLSSDAEAGGCDLATNAEVDDAIERSTKTLTLEVRYLVFTNNNGARRCRETPQSPPENGIAFTCNLSAASDGKQTATMRMACPEGYVATRASCAPATPFEYDVETFDDASVATCRAQVPTADRANFKQFLLCTAAAGGGARR